MRILKNRLEATTDEELMIAIQNGDSRALELLYYRYSNRLLVYFYRMLGSEEKAQDFLQEIFLKLIEHSNTFDAKKTFSSWIFSIAANMCKNEYRYMEVRKDTLNVEMDNGIINNDTEIGHELDRTQFRKRLQWEIQKLDTAQRHTFLLRFQENFSIKEISQILNLSEGTIKSRLFYITKKLANRLKDFNPRNNEVSYHEK